MFLEVLIEIEKTTIGAMLGKFLLTENLHAKSLSFSGFYSFICIFTELKNSKNFSKKHPSNFKKFCRLPKIFLEKIAKKN